MTFQEQEEDVTAEPDRGHTETTADCDALDIDDGGTRQAPEEEPGVRRGERAIFTANGDEETAVDTQVGVMDSGANCGVIPRGTAEKLGLKIVEDTDSYRIRFGDNVSVTVRHCVESAGFIDKLAVVDNAADTLILNKAWTARGLRVQFHRQRMIG